MKVKITRLLIALAIFLTTTLIIFFMSNIPDYAIAALSLVATVAVLFLNKRWHPEQKLGVFPLLLACLALALVLFFIFVLLKLHTIDNLYYCGMYTFMFAVIHLTSTILQKGKKGK